MGQRGERGVRDEEIEERLLLWIRSRKKAPPRPNLSRRTAFMMKRGGALPICAGSQTLTTEESNLDHREAAKMAREGVFSSPRGIGGRNVSGRDIIYKLHPNHPLRTCKMREKRGKTGETAKTGGRKETKKNSLLSWKLRSLARPALGSARRRAGCTGLWRHTHSPVGTRASAGMVTPTIRPTTNWGRTFGA